MRAAPPLDILAAKRDVQLLDLDAIHLAGIFNHGGYFVQHVPQLPVAARRAAHGDFRLGRGVLRVWWHNARAIQRVVLVEVWVHVWHDAAEVRRKLVVRGVGVDGSYGLGFSFVT